MYYLTLFSRNLYTYVYYAFVYMSVCLIRYLPPQAMTTYLSFGKTKNFYPLIRSLALFRGENRKFKKNLSKQGDFIDLNGMRKFTRNFWPNKKTMTNKVGYKFRKNFYPLIRSLVVFRGENRKFKKTCQNKVHYLICFKWHARIFTNFLTKQNND